LTQAMSNIMFWQTLMKQMQWSQCNQSHPCNLVWVSSILSSPWSVTLLMAFTG